MHFTVTEKRLPIGRPFARLRMNRRAPTILGMFILSLMTVSSLDGQPAREPFYEMRPARYWMTKLGESHIPNEIYGRSDRTKPEAAMRSVGAADALALYGPNARAATPALTEAANFELVINLKTAKALGLTIPQSLLRADEVIE